MEVEAACRAPFPPSDGSGQLMVILRPADAPCADIWDTLAGLISLSLSVCNV